MLQNLAKLLAAGVAAVFVVGSGFALVQELIKDATLQTLAENDISKFRNPNPIELDLRLAKDIHIWRGGLTLSVDLFNALNRQTILQRNVTRLSSGSSNQISELQSPRVFRLGARFNF